VRYADALIVHPNAGVRTVAVSLAVLDEPARILAADSAPQVRASLAARVSELAADVVATLEADQHPDVQRNLGTVAGLDDRNPA
jgi:hypothetical protein